ncbi:MAG: glycosyltransferase [Bacteroidota bacterium]
MNTDSNTLIFCVDNYSISFVQTEIKFLSKHFKKIIIISEEKSKSLGIQNVSEYIIDYSNYKTSRLLFSNFFIFFNLLFSELFACPKYFLFPKTIAAIASNLLRSFYVREELKKIIAKEINQPLMYTFWFNNWATALSLLVKEKSINEYFSRTHGTDLYEDRVPVFGRIPFRKFQLKYVAKVFSVSEKGETYLKLKYPQFSAKILCSYLGTEFHGSNPFDSNAVFTIVSCARIRNIKRIHLLAEIVSLIDFPIKWIHIGSENLNSGDSTIPVYLKNKEKALANKNVDLILTGNLTNKQVFELYKSTQINLFVSVSETEGLPVSMMEAISFGIPILSTDVGGCNEIVTNETGILIPKDFNCKDVAQTINKFSSSELNTIEFRLNIQKFWQLHFDNNKNGAKFIESIVSTTNGI